MKSRGFTIVELLIVIIVMAILLTLAVVNVRSTQIKARDNERHVDIENLATALESIYINNPSGYPDIESLGAAPWAYGLAEKVGSGSLHAPGVGIEEEPSFVASTNNNQTSSGVTPAPTTSTYVYQPLTRNNVLCLTYNQGCTKFNLFYRLEQPTDDCPAPSNICILRSNHR